MGKYYKVLKVDMSSVGLRGCVPIQYELNEWVHLSPPDKIRFAHQSVGGLNVLKNMSSVKWLQRYVKEKYNMDTRVFLCLIGEILYESSYKIETDKIKLVEELNEAS